MRRLKRGEGAEAASTEAASLVTECAHVKVL